ncbi:MAG: alpha/beta fold hydrolase [Gammaproteobacteria bacterium]
MTKIAIQIYGQGTPMVLFHGWGFDSQIWHSVLPDLLTLPYQIYLVDLPGFGGSSEMDWDNFKLQLLANLPEQFIVGGWSLGGLFATRLASEEPQRVLKLLQITSSPYFIQTENWAGIMPEILDDFYHQFMTAPQPTRQKFVQTQLPSGEVWEMPEQSDINISGLEDGLSVLKHWDLRDSLEHLSMPVAYLFGRLDRIVSHRVLDYLKLRYPQFNYTLLARSGHMPFLSHRAAFIEWIREVA